MVAGFAYLKNIQNIQANQLQSHHCKMHSQTLTDAHMLQCLALIIIIIIVIIIIMIHLFSRDHFVLLGTESDVRCAARPFFLYQAIKLLVSVHSNFI